MDAGRGMQRTCSLGGVQSVPKVPRPCKKFKEDKKKIQHGSSDLESDWIFFFVCGRKMAKKFHDLLAYFTRTWMLNVN